MDYQIESFASFVVGAMLVTASMVPTPIRAALALLPPATANGLPPITMVSPKGPIKNTGVEQVAWVEQGKSTIFVPNWSQTYKRAEKGDPIAQIKLAAAIAHEQYHLQHGPDEGPAYDEQLRVLRALNAPQNVIRSIEQSKALVTKK